MFQKSNPHAARKQVLPPALQACIHYWIAWMEEETRRQNEAHALQLRLCPSLPGAQEKLDYGRACLGFIATLRKRLPERQRWLEDLDKLPPAVLTANPLIQEVLDLCQANKPSAGHLPTLLEPEHSAPLPEHSTGRKVLPKRETA